jgi:hypothetical protein
MSVSRELIQCWDFSFRVKIGFEYFLNTNPEMSQYEHLLRAVLWNQPTFVVEVFMILP